MLHLILELGFGSILVLFLKIKSTNAQLYKAL